MFLNPIVIATFLGLFLWLAQAYLPQVTVAVKDATSGEMVNKSVSFMRLDLTSPQITQIFNLLSWFSFSTCLVSNWFYTWFSKLQGCDDRQEGIVLYIY